MPGIGVVYFLMLIIGALLKRNGKSHATRLLGNIFILASFFVIVIALWQFWSTEKGN